MGTANAIASLGGDQYLELIAIVDAAEAAGSARSRRVTRALATGETFATWALRVDDVEAAGALLGAGSGSAPGARVTPDGVRLEWRTLELPAAETGSGVPFLISWLTEEHPGADGGARVRRVVLEDAPAGPLATLLARCDLDVECELRPGERPRLVALEIQTDGRRAVVA